MDHHVLWPTLASITDATLDLSNLVAGAVELFDLAGVGATEEGLRRPRSCLHFQNAYVKPPVFEEAYLRV
jgi:hypothetical protein